MASAPEILDTFCEHRRWIAAWAFTVSGLLIALLLYAHATGRQPLFGFIGGRHTPPVAGPTGMTTVFIPQARRQFIGEIRREAAAETLAVLEAIGPHGAGMERAAYRVGGERVVGVLARPAGAPIGAVVLAHPYDEPYRTGLHTEATAARLAREGFVVFAPDFRGWGSSEGQRGTEALDAAVAVRALRARLEAEGHGGLKIGLVGYSFGGGAAAKAAAIEPVAALVLYYPQLGGTYEELRYHLATGDPSVTSSVRALAQGGRQNGADAEEVKFIFRMSSPIVRAAEITCPVLLFHSADDRTVSIRQSEAMERALREAGREVEFRRLDGLGHAFANEPENPTFEGLVAFLHRQLAPN